MGLFESIKNNLKESSDEVNYVINNGDYVLSLLIKSIGGEADLLVKAKNGKGTSAVIEGYDQIGGFEFTEEDEPFYSDGVFSTEDIEDLFHKFEPNIKINSLKRMGYDEEELEESEEPLKEASQVTACRNAIEKAKQKLKRSKFGENFGQDEVRKLKDKFDDLSYSEENKQIKDMINDFDDWCANYVPMRESEGQNSNLEALNELLAEWDFVVDVTEPYISSIGINGDNIAISCELWDPDLDDYVSIDGGEYTAPEIVDMINKADFFQDRDTMSYYREARDILAAIQQKTDWQDLCNQLYSELHKQLRAEGYEDENGNRIEEAEHPLDFKKYEVTIKRDNGLGDLTTIMVNTSEDAVRDYVTGKGYEVVNIKDLGYPGGNPENKNELQNKANKVVRNMAKMRESQTQEIDAVLKALKEKNPNIEKYLNAYYKSIADTEPRPAYDKEKDRMDPAWENWNKTTNNVLYSREAWENFTKWVKEKYGENLNETEELKEGSDYWNDKFGQEALDEYKNNQDKNGIPKGETPFKVGDPVYYSYLSDNNKHNGLVGNIEWLRKYQYYPFGHKGDSDTVIYKWQGSIKYPDGSTESIGDAYAKGGGVTSPLRIAPKEFKPGDKIPWDYKLGEAEETKKGPTLEEDEYNAVDYFLTDSKMYDSGFYLKQDKNMKDYFVDAEDNNKKYSLKNGLHVIYEAMVPEYIAEYPKDIQKGLEKVMRKYLGDQIGDEIKSWCSKPKKEAESIKTVCGLEDGKSYWAYISKHGLGPGTIPNDVEATCVCDLPETGKTLFCVDRQLTPEELDKYELALFDNSYFNKYPEVVKELMALK